MRKDASALNLAGPLVQLLQTQNRTDSFATVERLSRDRHDHAPSGYVKADRSSGTRPWITVKGHSRCGPRRQEL